MQYRMPLTPVTIKDQRAGTSTDGHMYGKAFKTQHEMYAYKKGWQERRMKARDLMENHGYSLVSALDHYCTDEYVEQANFIKMLSTHPN